MYTRDISFKSMHVFLSNLANRQTDKHRQKHLPPPLSEVNNAHTFSDDTESVTRWAGSMVRVLVGYLKR